MKYIQPLDEQSLTMLRALYHQAPIHRVRQRAHIILMSFKGLPINEIALVTELDRDTVSLTLDKWEKEGLLGLYDEPRTGRPPRFNQQEQQWLVEQIKKEPRQLKKTLAEVESLTGKHACVETIKRVARRENLTWKRARTKVAGEPAPEEYEMKKKKLVQLTQRAANQEIALYFQDESGFSLTPCVPYAWQSRGQTLAIPSTRSPRLQVLGALEPNGEWKSLMMEGRLTSARFIEAIDQLFPSVVKETWLVLDNSPIHTSHSVKQQQVVWEKRGLHCFFLPPYSPHLNLAEIVWRFIKYYWLPFSAYLSFKHFKKTLENILDNIGIKYLITFV